MTNILFLCIDDVGQEQFANYDEGVNANASGVFQIADAERPVMPNIEAIGSNGRIFERFYATPSCSPTRTCWLTGRFGTRTGVGEVVDSDTVNPLLEAEVTFPELLKAAGLPHKIANIGKSHVMNGLNGGNDAMYRMGFDYFAGTKGNISGAMGEDHYRYDEIVQGEERRNRGTWSSERTTQQAIRWIQERRGNPWVALVNYNIPHDPYTVPPAGFFDTATWGNPPATPHNLHKAMLESVDVSIGKLLAEIDYTETVVFFITDNGTASARLAEETHPGGGVIAYPAGHGKRTTFEPGIRCPMYVRGPAAIVDATGGTETRLFHAVDFYTTWAAILGIPDVTPYLPVDRAFDGMDLSHYLLGDPGADRETIYCEVFAPNNPNAGTTGGIRTALGTRYKLRFTMAGVFSSYGFYDMDALWYDKASPATPFLWETSTGANLLDPAGSGTNDLANLSASERTEYDALIAYLDALFASVDLDYALQP